MRVTGPREMSEPVWHRAIALELRRAILWLPVIMGAGIALYFAWDREPPGWTVWTALVPAAGLAWRPARLHLAARCVLMALAALATGHGAALVSARLADAPVLQRPAAITLEGRVVMRDKAQSGAPRVLLDHVTLFGRDGADTPRRVRVTLLATPPEQAPDPGAWIHVHATLLPPGLPVEPGAFDFARRAWFEGIGAVGYARTPALRVPVAEAIGARDGDSLLDALRIRLAALRIGLADAIRAALPGAEGAFAAAIIVGDRAAIPEADSEALRISSLAHLLAISGLHMGILTGLVFATVRIGLATIPAIALRYPTKKWAAVAALLTGVAYLLLSGATVATQRAFVMVAVMLMAVLLDRPAVSLRALALAAAIILAIRPVSLVDAGFQMSFAATIALVASYEALRERTMRRARPEGPAPGRAMRGLRLLALYAAGVVFTSLVAGSATAPFAGYHFNRLASYGLLANLGAVPVMGRWIAPTAVLAGLAAPFGLAEPMLALMGAGIAWVLGVAHWVASLPGADAPLVATHPAALVLLALGGLWLAIWRGPWRLGGALAIAAGLAVWPAGADRPDLIVAPRGALVGVMTAGGRVLDHPRASSYAAETWLRRDGDRITQELAAGRDGLMREGRVTRAALGSGWQVAVVRGRKDVARNAEAACGPGVLVVASTLDERPAGSCRFLGARDIAALGAVAVWAEPGGLRIAGSRPVGTRPWQAAGAARR